MGFLINPFLFAPGHPFDDMESYANLAPVEGLNGGVSWPSGYVDRANILGFQAFDDMESYTDSAALNGLNGGNGFSAGYTNHDN